MFSEKNTGLWILLTSLVICIIASISILITRLDTVIPIPSDEVIAEVKERHPDYFGLDTENGLKVFVWQETEKEYCCILFEGHIYPTRAEIENYPIASATDMKKILTSYRIPEEKIIVVTGATKYNNYAPGEEDIADMRELLGLNRDTKNNLPLKVTFEDIKDEIVGGYSLGEWSNYSYEFIFFENGNYIVIHNDSMEKLTQENTTPEYFIRDGEYGREILIRLTDKNNKTYDVWGTSLLMRCKDIGFMSAEKTTPDSYYKTTGKGTCALTKFQLSDFEHIVPGESNYRTMWEAAVARIKKNIPDFPPRTLTFPVYLSPIGDVTDFPTEDGRYIRFLWNEDLTVKSIEVVDEVCEVYY